MRALWRRLRRRIGRRDRDPADHAARLAREEMQRRRNETYTQSSRPPDPSGGGPFAG